MTKKYIRKPVFSFFSVSLPRSNHVNLLEHVFIHLSSCRCRLPSYGFKSFHPCPVCFPLLAQAEGEEEEEEGEGQGVGWVLEVHTSRRGRKGSHGKVSGAQVERGSGAVMTWGGFRVEDRRGIRPRSGPPMWTDALLGYFLQPQQELQGWRTTVVSTRWRPSA